VSLEELRERNRELREELRGCKGRPEGWIGLVLLFLGFLMLGLAVYYSHQVSAFIGIALTFWGALLLYVRPTRFVKKEVLDSVIMEPTMNYTKILDEFGYKGTPTYISPGTLWGMSNTTLYIPKKDDDAFPSDEQLSGEEIFIDNPQGLKLTPPGQPLSRLVEEDLGANFSTEDLEYLIFNLEKALVEGLEMVEGFNMEQEENRVVVEVEGSIFIEGVNQLEDEVDRCIGDPLSSALACIIARTTRQPVTITDITKTQEGLLRIEYTVHETAEAESEQESE